jgi:cell division transport system ATP-binding protein
MIRFENISKVYPGSSPALENINLHIDTGEFISIVGHSGAGKSTLLKLLYTEERPTTGVVSFDSANLLDLKKKELPILRRLIGTVFQDYKLLQKKTLAENVSFAMEVAGKSDAEINETVPKILDIVGLGHKANHYPLEVSGGEQQRVALARALVNKPKVLIADEPTGNLDPASTWEIIQLLLKINEFGTTVLLATHNKEIVDRITKRVVIMEEGKIVSDKQKGKYQL